MTTPILRAFVDAANANKRENDEEFITRVVDRALKIESERSENEESRYHVIPEPKKREDLRLIEI